MKLWIVVSPVKPDSIYMLKVKLISEAIDGNNTQFVGLQCILPGNQALFASENTVFSQV